MDMVTFCPHRMCIIYTSPRSHVGGGDRIEIETLALLYAHIDTLRIRILRTYSVCMCNVFRVFIYLYMICTYMYIISTCARVCYSPRHRMGLWGICQSPFARPSRKRSRSSVPYIIIIILRARVCACR